MPRQARAVSNSDRPAPVGIAGRLQPRLAYSYLRFSSPGQAEGDSVRRQAQLRDDYVSQNGLFLDDSIRMVDDGVSAHKGTNLSDSAALGRFVALVKAGRVPRDSYLLIENLDRLSRDEAEEGLYLLLTLIRAGVRVVQLSPVVCEFSKGNCEPMKLMMAIMELSRGNSESKMKSERIGQAWRQKKRKAGDGGVLTRMVPGWIAVATTGRLALIPERAAIVRKIYRLAIEGQGRNTIARKLNAEGVPPFDKAAKCWNGPAVAWILTTRTIIGEYQPKKEVKEVRETKDGGRRVVSIRLADGEPVPNYYPAAVPEKTFHAARAAIGLRLHRPVGRPGETVNVFAGLLKDARDGGSIGIIKRREKRMLVSLRSVRGFAGSKYVAFPWEVFERHVLTQLAEVDQRTVLPDDTSGEDEMAVRGELEKVRALIERLKEKVGENPDLDSLIDSMRRQEQRERDLVRKLEEVRRIAATPLGEAWAECKSVMGLIDAAESKEKADEVKVRVRAAVQRIVDGVWCVFVGVGKNNRDRLAIVQVWFHGGGHREYGIFYSSPITGAAQREEQLSAETFPVSDNSGRFDLRDKAKAALFIRAIEGDRESPRHFFQPWLRVIQKLMSRKD